MNYFITYKDNFDFFPSPNYTRFNLPGIGIHERQTEYILLNMTGQSNIS